MRASREKPLDDRQAREALSQVFDAAIDCAAASDAVIRNLPEKPAGRCIVVGAGKASAAMAAALDSAWPDVDVSGIVSTRYGHGVPAGRITVIEAGHPVPDAASEDAARHAFSAVSNLKPDDLVVALISGGGSATMSLPIKGLSLAEKQDINRQLLASGASISEINLVRKYLSAIKGGKLAAAAAPARVLTLIISDVPGDEAALVASGPTIPCNTSPDEALDVLHRYQIDVPAAVQREMTNADSLPATAVTETHRIIASNAQSMKAAAREARNLGFEPVILGDALEGESRELGRTIAGIAKSVRSMGEPACPPAMLLSGGETTVTIGPEGAGRGGRNTEFLLSLALELKGESGTWALAADSDGIDGTEDAAGAFVSPDTLKRAVDNGMSPREMLRKHDSYGFFLDLGDLLKTGPTLTNVNDIRVVMVV